MMLSKVQSFPSVLTMYQASIPRFRAQEDGLPVMVPIVDEIKKRKQEELALKIVAKAFRNTPVRHVDDLLFEELGKLYYETLSPQEKTARQSSSKKQLITKLVGRAIEMLTIVNKSVVQDTDLWVILNTLQNAKPFQSNQAELKQCILLLTNLASQPGWRKRNQNLICSATLALQQASNLSEVEIQAAVKQSGAQEIYDFLETNDYIEVVPSKCPHAFLSIWRPIANKLFPAKIRVTQEIQEKLAEQRLQKLLTS